MKTAPVIAALARRRDPVRHVLVHTGQHYDEAMSRVFLDQLSVGEPDHMLGVGSGTHAVQTARVMERLEPILLAERPDLLVVPGDVNSTLAGALVASKLGIPIAHLEAGLRSTDRTMPEEVNRVLVDAVSDLLFTHSPEARPNLVREGCDPARIHEVGNTMIDTLVTMRPQIEALDVPRHHGLEPASYVVVTLHRPALTDGWMLGQALEALGQVARSLPVVFCIHPRTSAAIASQELEFPAGVLRLEPLGYLEFLSLVLAARAVLTDSGGIQEETTFLGIPCFTLRDNTERPITCTIGTNVLLGLRPDRITEIPSLLDAQEAAPRGMPDGWDGHAAERVAVVVEETCRARRDGA